MGILKKAAKTVADKAEDVVLGRTERDIQKAEKAANEGGKR